MGVGNTVDYTKTCHRLLKQYQRTQTGFRVVMEKDSAMEEWGNKVTLLRNKIYLLCPTSIEQCNGMIEIIYPLFVFCLDKEMVVRRQNNAMFRELQLWKIMKSLLGAVVQWASVYPNEELKGIVMSNVLIDTSGKLKLISKYSFFKRDHTPTIGTYNHGQVYKYWNYLEEIGRLLMELSTLRENTLQLDLFQEFKEMTRFSNAYKMCVMRMVTKDISIEQCCQLIKENKLKTM